MLNNLKNLIKIKPEIDESRIENASKGSSQFEEISLREKGINESSEVNGNSSVLAANLENLFQLFCREQGSKEEFQEQLRQPKRRQLEQLNSRILENNKRIALIESDVNDINDNIKEIDKEIIDVPANPAKYGIQTEKRPGVLFYLGIIFITGITLFLIAFYSSAFYNAFIKQHISGQALAESFTDPDMFSNIHGLEWLIVIFGPFIFLALGYLIHMFSKDKAKGTEKLIYLFSVTLVFDLILAYLISKNFYDANSNNMSAPFSFIIALKMVQFWGFIFCGFIVYLVWGFVLDFVLDLYDNLDQIWKFIKGLKERRRLAVTRLETLISNRNEVSVEITKFQGQIKELESELNNIIIHKQEYLPYQTSYFTGWVTAIGKWKDPNVAQNEALRKRADDLIMECERVRDEHLRKHNLNGTNGNYTSESK